MVVLIIGILAAVALPQYQVAVRKARVAEMNTVTRAFKNAEEVYYMGNGRYMRDFSELDITPPAGVTVEPNGNWVLRGIWIILLRLLRGESVCVAYNDKISARGCQSLGGVLRGESCGGMAEEPGCLLYLLP